MIITNLRTQQTARARKVLQKMSRQVIRKVVIIRAITDRQAISRGVITRAITDRQAISRAVITRAVTDRQVISRVVITRVATGRQAISRMGMIQMETDQVTGRGIITGRAISRTTKIRKNQRKIESQERKSRLLLEKKSVLLRQQLFCLV